MRYILTILFLWALSANGQDTSQYTPMKADYKFGKAVFKNNLWIPADTSNYKTGIARISSVIYAGNGTKWTAQTGSSGGGRVDSTRIKSVPYIDSVFEYVSGTRVYIGKIYKKDGLQSGGEVRRITTNDYELTAAYYTIEGLDYSAVADTLTLNAYSDSAQFAAIYANTASIFQVRYGDKSSSPIPPVINKSEEVLISLVLLMDTGRVIYGSEIDTTFLSDRINLKVDSVTRLVDGCQSILKYWIRGNAVVIDTFYKPNGIISGGNFTRINDTTFRIDTTRYSIGCVVRTVNQQNVILNGNNQNSTGRIDVIGVDNTGNPFVQQGINSVAPSIPQINTATQIGLLTVTFPALSDSGITNIYNTTVYNGLDSSAYRTIVQVDSFTIALCNLRGLCDTITRIYEAPKYVDSLRRSNDSVYARINNEWRFQYKDSVGTGGGSGGDTLNATINPWANNKKFFRHMAGVIRATASGNSQPITWAFLDTTTAHTQIAFDSVKGQGNEIKLFYPKVKNVNALIVTPDETLAQAGVICGSSVGDSVSSVLAYTTTLNCGQLTGNTSSWTNGSVSLSGLSYSTSTGLTIFSPTTGGTGTVYASSPEILGAQITYVGSGNKRVRRVYSGLSGQTIGFYLVDSANVIITGNLASTDIVAISIPRTRVVPLPAQTTSSNGFPSDIYTSTANFWIIASMEVFMIGYPLPGTGRVKLEWQTAKTGSSNYATSYRITRSAMATPNTETDIFSGFGFEVVDSGLTANTGYIYRMYATILGTERLITNEKVYTNP